jgi:hypothetical protein
MLRQFAFEHFPIGKFRHLANRMRHHHGAKAFIDIGLTRQTKEGGEARASGQHPKAAPR